MTRTYPATLRRIVDGDTYVLDVDLGFYVTTAQHIRVRNINCPEVHGATKEAGLAAAKYAEGLLTARQLTITTYKDDRSFERWVADVTLVVGDSPKSVADEMVAAGHAVVVSG